jgi:hypothetical protein
VAKIGFREQKGASLQRGVLRIFSYDGWTKN